jgi:uncharacterized coiled-coil protein SlyX
MLENTNLEQKCAQGKKRPNPERIDSTLRRLGFVPDAEDRIRRLELAVATLAEDLAEMLELLTKLRHEIHETDASLGRLRDRISVTGRS